MDWNKLTLEKFALIQNEIDGVEEEDEKILRAAAAFANMSYDVLVNMPLTKAQCFIEQVGFLYNKPQPAPVKKNVVINHHRYHITDAEELTVAQFIDYQALGNEWDKKIIDLMCIILIPEGHRYNDGYDKELVKTDMKMMMVTEALGISNFFIRKCRKLLRHTLLYLSVKMKVVCLMSRDERVKTMTKAMEKQMERLAEHISSFGYQW